MLCQSLKQTSSMLPGIAAIVDITETGSSLRANKLRILDTILSSTTRLIANKTAMQDPVKAAKIEDLALPLQGAIAGRQSVGLKLNCLLMDLESVVAVLPSQLSPTVSPLKNGVGVAVEVVLAEAQARDVGLPPRRSGGLRGLKRTREPAPVSKAELELKLRALDAADEADDKLRLKILQREIRRDEERLDLQEQLRMYQ